MALYLVQGKYKTLNTINFKLTILNIFPHMEVLYTKSVGFSVFLEVGIILRTIFTISLPPHIIGTDRQETTYESCNSIENLLIAS